VSATLLRQSTCVALGAPHSQRAVLIEGAPGCGKSSLALALIDRGACLVGDDGVALSTRDGRLFASPAPATRGLLEVRGLGILPFPWREAVPVALLLRLDPAAPRFIEAADQVEIAGIALPMVSLWPESPVLALRAELALAHYGIPPA
jgi:serine kinase of HPr protein (carbohydrate metabolism regulator)